MIQLPRRAGKRASRSNRPWLIVLVIVVLALFFGSYFVVRYELSKSKKPTVTLTPTPPGHPGNGGDTAKEQLQRQPSTPSPTATPKNNPPVISNFSVESLVGGKAHAIDYVSGVTNATCTLHLISPDGKQNQNLSGQLVWAGQYYDCGVGSITGVTENGVWSATLTVTSLAGASAKSNTTFTVGGN